MGTHKYIDQIEELFRSSPVLSFHTISRAIRKGKHVNYAKQLVHYLTKQERIKPVLRGWYTTRTDPSLAVLCMQPAYLGLQCALSQHDLWEQETAPIILTTRHVRQGLRTVLGANAFLHRLPPKTFFGITHLQDGSLVLPYSDIEKTLIDMIVFKQPLSQEVIQAINKKINKKKLKNYLSAYNANIRQHVLRIIK